MKVLIAGSNGYIGRHVTKMFAESGCEVYTYSREKTVTLFNDGAVRAASDLFGHFDVVVNCARPHWSEFSPEQIVELESKLLIELDRLATSDAIKIHTSGVWLFGHASNDDLHSFTLQPFESVKLDAATIHDALRRHWHIVYCPSLVYGGENCQLKRIIASWDGGPMQVAIPSKGYNQYVHVNDVARFYMLLVDAQTDERQHFIAEPKGYTPEEFSQLLLHSQSIRKVENVSWCQFETNNGTLAVDIEKLNLVLPVSSLFESTHSIHRYLEHGL